MVHDHYGSGAPSGENRVFEMERDLLTRHGHDVEIFERHSDTLRSQGKIGMIKGALSTPWNPGTSHKIKEAILRFQPDVMHAHNTFPTISPSIFSAARGCARVLTLHNYRLVCPAAIPMRNGTSCTECIDRKSVKPAIAYGCYRSSRVATLPLAAKVALHRWRGTWQRDVETFIALSDFQRTLMARAGLPIERISVKPNFYSGRPQQTPYKHRPARVVFAGRLSLEKGVGDLIEAWLKWGPEAPELRILGDGELRVELQSQSAMANNITFLGQVDPQTVEAEIGQARLVVLPSRCFETFGLVLVEAFAHGTPVAVSDKGPLPEIASQTNGIIFRANDPASLLARVRECWSDPDRLTSMAEASKKVFASHYSEKRNLKMLLDIYHSAIEAACARQEP